MICVFMLGIIIAIGAGYYRQVNNQERFSFALKLPVGEVQNMAIDIGKQGWPKSILQPGKVLILTGRQGIKNTSNEPLDFQVQLTGLPGKIYQHFPSQDWQALGDNDFIQLAPQQAVALRIETDIPRGKIDQYQVGTAELVCITAEQEIVGKISFQFINSQRQGSADK